MPLTLLAVLSLMSNPIPDDPTPAWVRDALRQAPPFAQMPSPTPSSATPWCPAGATDRDANKRYGFDSEVARQEAIAMPVRKRVFELLDNGGYEEAYQEARRFDEEYPEEWVGNWHQLAESALLASHYAEAGALCRRRIAHGMGGDSDLMYLGLSLALASQGRLVDGQAAFAGESLARTARQEEIERLPDRLRLPATPHEVALTSAVALGMGSMHPLGWFEWALRLDPRCQVAARRLVEEYAGRGQRADAARVARSMVDRLPPGPSREEFARRLGFLEGNAPKPVEDDGEGFRVRTEEIKRIE